MGFLVRANDRLIRFAPEGKVLKARDHLVFLQAEEVLDRALVQARQILDAAQTGYDLECKRGYADGQEEAKLEAAEHMIDTVSRAIDYFGKIETRVVELVLTALRKILSEFDERERVVQVVKNALSVVRNQKQVTLRLNPAQADMARERINDLLSAYPAIGFLEITPDARLRPDACIIESEIGSVEAGIEVQLDAIRRAFEKSLGSRHG
ncbi:HrpE/YscL family type III secretion apparatus protein [Telmatospirillum sp. J64-1]|uniref:HrpE/YscL family type III secretion apparatus protein n=1 Tax=Telmatospirillum sp. J64-1 TaxID=2502183 RepID=UPI00115CFBF9|nr:HrpE/YscL family type III secretion apparatus protein [Telmatospirillum sp. J64-1]